MQHLAPNVKILLVVPQVGLERLVKQGSETGAVCSIVTIDNTRSEAAEAIKNGKGFGSNY